jgi:intracellular sulfur oxidation DsrE/DsrF family protein
VKLRKGIIMRALVFVLVVLVTTPSTLAREGFVDGKVIPAFGKVAPVRTTFAVPEGMELKLSFDVARTSNGGDINNDIAKLARLINMHGEGGLDPQELSLAMVVHGPAVHHVTKTGKDGEPNTNRALIEALLAQDVKIIVCGQSAAYMGVGTPDLIEGVEMALSAMTAHAVLQRQGYALNPF